jgi:hypothetical protein
MNRAPTADPDRDLPDEYEPDEGQGSDPFDPGEPMREEDYL